MTVQLYHRECAHTLYGSLGSDVSVTLNVTFDLYKRNLLQDKSGLARAMSQNRLVECDT